MINGHSNSPAISTTLTDATATWLTRRRGSMTMIRIRIPRRPSGAPIYTGHLAKALQPGWKLLWLSATRSPSAWVATLLLGANNAAPRSREVFIGLPSWPPGFGLKFVVVHLDNEIADLTVRLHGHQSEPDAISLAIFALPRAISGAFAFLQNMGAFRRALRAAVNRLHNGTPAPRAHNQLIYRQKSSVG